MALGGAGVAAVCWATAAWAAASTCACCCAASYCSCSYWPCAFLCWWADIPADDRRRGAGHDGGAGREAEESGAAEFF